jgi:hypothetical protein
MLEAFVPVVLRQRTEQDGPMTLLEKSILGPEAAVVRLLRQAREQKGLDILAHMGMKHKRWPAVHWLMNCLLDKLATFKRMDKSSTYTSCFALVRPSLDEMTNLNLEIDPYKPSAMSLPLDIVSNAAYPEDSGSSFQMGATALRDDTMGQIWQCLGSMVVKATDLPDDEAEKIMSHVFRILAHIHHLDLVPPGVYAHDPATDPSAILRPPIVQLLSSRILSTMSDAVWNAHEQEVALATGEEPIDLSRYVHANRHKFKVRDLGLEVWVEFILWCCVDGGFLKEGTWILKEVKASGNWHQWKIVDWPTVVNSSSNSNFDPPRVDLKRLLDRAHMVISETEGYSFDRPFVEMGNRTISGEVVFTLIDGLINTVRTGAGIRGSSLGSVLEDITQLKSILEVKRVDVKAGFWDCVVIRLIESSGVDPSVDPSSVDKILSFVPVSPKQVSLGNLSNPENRIQSDDAFTNSAVRLGLHYHLLHNYCEQGDVRKALNAFENCYFGLLNFITALNRDLFIGHFSESTGDRKPLSFNPKFYEDPSSTPARLPIPLVPSLLDLLSSARVHEFGRWLLYSNEVEGGPFIPDAYFKNHTLAPYLIRFATASSDHNLFVAVTRSVPSPTTRDTLRATLQFHAAQSNWSAVESILDDLKNEMQVGWGIGDAMAIAAKILDLEKALHNKQFSDSSRSDLVSLHLHTASVILRRLLRGHWTPAVNPSLRINLRPEDMLNQLSRILASIPGTLSTIAREAQPAAIDETLPFNHLPTNAFNMLLATLVETRGPHAGKRLWDQWCFPPRYLEAEKIQDGGIPILRRSSEMSTLPEWPVTPERASRNEALRGKLVVPNLRTFRTLVRAAVSERRKMRSPEIDDMMDWIVEMFRAWGVANTKNVDRELDGYLTERAQRARREKVNEDPSTTALEKVKQILIRRYDDSSVSRSVVSEARNRRVDIELD